MRQEAKVCEYLERQQRKLKEESLVWKAYRLVILDVAARGLERNEKLRAQKDVKDDGREPIDNLPNGFTFEDNARATE